MSRRLRSAASGNGERLMESGDIPRGIKKPPSESQEAKALLVMTRYYFIQDG
jgi:hypothetical protein